MFGLPCLSLRLPPCEQQTSKCLKGMRDYCWVMKACDKGHVLLMRRRHYLFNSTVYRTYYCGITAIKNLETAFWTKKKTFNTFTAVKFDSHWYVSIPGSWSKTDVTCRDCLFKYMINYSVSVCVAGKLLNWTDKKLWAKPSRTMAVW